MSNMRRALFAFALFVLLVLLAYAAIAAAARSAGPPCKVTLYSGGKAVRTWTSAGSVFVDWWGGGASFDDAETHKPVRVRGSVVVETR